MDTNDYEELRDSIEKLCLNDASLNVGERLIARAWVPLRLTFT